MIGGQQKRYVPLAALIAVVATASESLASALHAASSATAPGLIKGAVFVGPSCGADEELMILTTTHGHEERRRSYELLAEAYLLAAT